MTYLQAKVQGQRVSRFRTEWKQTETDRQTEVIALPPSLTRSLIDLTRIMYKMHYSNVNQPADYLISIGTEELTRYTVGCMHKTTHLTVVYDKIYR